MHGSSVDALFYINFVNPFPCCRSGDVPPTVTGWRVLDSSSEQLEVEVDVRWRGDPNISFFVELALAG